MKKVAFLLMALVMAVSFGFVNIDEVHAAGDYQIGLEDLMWANDPVSQDVDVHNIESGASCSVTKVTSSKKNVVKIEKYSFDGKSVYYAYAKKPGTSVIKVTFKNESGKKQTIKKKIRVKKYPKPIKRLKVNGKSVNLSKNKYMFDKKYSGTKVKVKITPKSGWVISTTYGHYYDKNWDMKNVNVSAAQILKGKAIKFAKKYRSMDVIIDLRNNKTGDTMVYVVNFFRS